jgi:hypothetical protein
LFGRIGRCHVFRLGGGEGNSRLTAAFPGDDSAIDFENVAGSGPSSVHVTSPVGISIAEEDPLAAVTVKHEAEIGCATNVA